MHQSGLVYGILCYCSFDSCQMSFLYIDIKTLYVYFFCSDHMLYVSFYVASEPVIIVLRNDVKGAGWQQLHIMNFILASNKKAHVMVMPSYFRLKYSCFRITFLRTVCSAGRSLLSRCLIGWLEENSDFKTQVQPTVWLVVLRALRVTLQMVKTYEKL